MSTVYAHVFSTSAMRLCGRDELHGLPAGLCRYGRPASPKVSTLQRTPRRAVHRHLGKRRKQPDKFPGQTIAAAADADSGITLQYVTGKALKLLHSRHDRDILNLAIPALFSIMLDPIMSLTDTGNAFGYRNLVLKSECMLQPLDLSCQCSSGRPPRIRPAGCGRPEWHHFCFFFCCLQLSAVHHHTLSSSSSSSGG